jgi:ankyrin repeat protein
VRMLLAKGADFEVRDIDGRTILRIAEYNRHETIVQMLKSKIQSARSRRDSRSPEHRHVVNYSESPVQATLLKSGLELII